MALGDKHLAAWGARTIAPLIPSRQLWSDRDATSVDARATHVLTPRGRFRRLKEDSWRTGAGQRGAAALDAGALRSLSKSPALVVDMPMFFPLLEAGP